MTNSKIQQQVSTLLDKINSGAMTVQQLQNAYANTENHADVTDEQHEDLVEAITTQMRKAYPSVANKKFGPINRDSRQKLEEYLADLRSRFDLSQNGHKTKVKVGGDVIKGETLVNDYISYRNQETKVMCHLFFAQKDHEAPRQLHVVMNELKAWGQNDSERIFPETSFDEACAAFEDYLKRVLRGELPE
ncbi:hypothetical protein [Aliiroseovarius zhejiangensis]|nr:hypothetical protein [Aliiroseovarius zhejiangensis]